jgi:hypothetical protein
MESDVIKLQPINNRFKRLIHDFGDEWIVLHAPRAMVCFNGALGVTCHPKSDPNKISNFKVAEVQNG